MPTTPQPGRAKKLVPGRAAPDRARPLHLHHQAGGPGWQDAWGGVVLHQSHLPPPPPPEASATGVRAPHIQHARTQAQTCSCHGAAGPVECGPPNSRRHAGGGTGGWWAGHASPLPPRGNPASACSWACCCSRRWTQTPPIQTSGYSAAPRATRTPRAPYLARHMACRSWTGKLLGGGGSQSECISPAWPVLHDHCA